MFKNNRSRSAAGKVEQTDVALLGLAGVSLVSLVFYLWSGDEREAQLIPASPTELALSGTEQGARVELSLPPAELQAVTAIDADSSSAEAAAHRRQSIFSESNVQSHDPLYEQRVHTGLKWAHQRFLREPHEGHAWMLATKLMMVDLDMAGEAVVLEHVYESPGKLVEDFERGEFEDDLASRDRESLHFMAGQNELRRYHAKHERFPLLKEVMDLRQAKRMKEMEASMTLTQDQLDNPDLRLVPWDLQQSILAEAAARLALFEG